MQILKVDECKKNTEKSSNPCGYSVSIERKSFVNP